MSKSIYQAGYSTEPGHMKTTGVFSPNVESTRIGATMILTTVESTIEPSQPREQLRLITPGVTKQASSRVNTSTPEAARSMILHQEDNRQVKSPEQPSVTAAAAVLATPGEASVEDNNPEADIATTYLCEAFDTEEGLENSNNVCIICRGETMKKLPCNHTTV